MQLPELPGYQYEDLLGEDPFGWTFVCSYHGEERRVVKVLKSQATNDRFLYRYLKAFAENDFDSSGVVKIHDYAFQDRGSPTAYAMPFFGWRGRESKEWQVTSLQKLVHLISEDQAVDIVRKLAGSLAAIHEKGIFHGGLRPANIFLTSDSGDEQRVEIADFGQIFMGGLQYLEAGDLLFYASPEQLATGDFSGENGIGWDVYAFGVIAFQLLTGHLPRLDRLRQQCEEQPDALASTAAIAFGRLTEVAEHFLAQLELEKPVEWPEEPIDERAALLREVLEGCLKYDAEARPTTMVEVAEAIEAAWETAPEIAGEGTGGLKEAGVSSASALVPFPKQSIRSRAGSMIRHFGEHPVRKWQVATVASLIAVLPLSYFALYSYWQYRTTQEESTIEAAELQASAAELQASVEQQAEAYRKVLLAEQRSTKNLQSELNETEDSRSRLLGEAKLARQILRQTQENGDQFFRLVLENRDTDVPGFREEREKALVEGRKHYERLVEAYGDASDFIVSTANALFYLGQIYKEMGEFGKALASFGEAERRYLALLEDSDSPDAAFVKNLAISKSSLGSLSSRDGRYSMARHYFTESSRYWAEVRNLSSGEALNAATRIHANSLAIVECELAMGRLDAALDGTRSIGGQLLELQEKDPDNDRIVGTLAHSFELAGRILESQGEGELAKEAYQQSSDLFARAVKLNAAIDGYRLGLGNSLARLGLLGNDIEKLEGAAEVLAKVVRANPYEPSYQKTLADTYGVLARNQRDGGKLENAISLEQEALSILQPIIRENRSSPPDVLFSYAERLAHLAELLGDEGSFDESRPPLREAITVLEKIGKSENALAAHHRALARARGLAGFACVKSGDKSEAKEHLELAKAEWETYIAANPNDPDAEQAVQWTSDQLRGLQ
ncbi:MAG: protein kinase [Verrucomicrobiales bacterium]